MSVQVGNYFSIVKLVTQGKIKQPAIGHIVRE